MTCYHRFMETWQYPGDPNSWLCDNFPRDFPKQSSFECSFDPIHDVNKHCGAAEVAWINFVTNLWKFRLLVSKEKNWATYWRYISSTSSFKETEVYLGTSLSRCPGPELSPFKFSPASGILASARCITGTVEVSNPYPQASNLIYFARKGYPFSQTLKS